MLIFNVILQRRDNALNPPKCMVFITYTLQTQKQYGVVCLEECSAILYMMSQEALSHHRMIHVGTHPRPGEALLLYAHQLPEERSRTKGELQFTLCVCLFAPE